MKSQIFGLVAVVALLGGCNQEPPRKWLPVMTTEAEVRACIGDEEFDRQRAEEKAGLEAARLAEENESAAWYGKTGLPVEVERGVAQYLRLEFGELAGEDGALRADELEYLGAFPEQERTVHFWKIPARGTGLCAYVSVNPNGPVYVTGFGDKRPPRKES